MSQNRVWKSKKNNNFKRIAIVSFNNALKLRIVMIQKFQIQLN